ncbi:MAG TPA: 4Fe-4S binding protein [Clostridia bacterium]|nr:4Fe-4S binding protein [Clostridia bacterium]
MSEVGVLLCDCQGAGSNLMDPVRLGADAFGDIEMIKTRHLCDPNEIARISSEMIRRGVKRLVIGACGTDYARSAVGLPLVKNGWPAQLLEFVPLVELFCGAGAAGTSAIDEERALSSVRLVLKRGIERIAARKWEPPVYRRPRRRVGIIGGGVAGLLLARCLEAAGVQAVVIERENELGGYLRKVSSLDVDGGKVEVQVVSALKERLICKEAPSRNGKLEFRTCTEAVHIKGGPGRFVISFSPDGEEEVGAVVLATGYSCEFHPEDHGLPSSGWMVSGRGPVVYSMSALEEALGRETFDNLEHFRGKKVAFVVDVSTGDSKVFTVSGLKNATRLRREFACEVYFFARDAKVSGADLESLYGAARRAGVVFVKREGSKPSITIKPTEGKAGGKALISCLLPSLGGGFMEKPLKIEVDLVCLDERLLPSVRDESLCASLEIGSGRNLRSDAMAWRPGRRAAPGSLSRFQEENVRLYTVRTAREGVWAIGGARGDQDLPESLTDASCAAMEIKEWLDGYEALASLTETDGPTKPEGDHHEEHREGGPERDIGAIGTSGSVVLFSRDGWQALVRAVVDEQKCARCLTCVRVCPHRAIKVLPFGESERRAAEVDPAACRGCGTCASACPGRAIRLTAFSDEEFLAELEVMGEYL